MGGRQDRPKLTRNEARERLREYYFISQHDPETAHICADEVLLELIDDPQISDMYRSIRRFHT
jgi:hypothetical protein